MIALQRPILLVVATFRNGPMEGKKKRGDRCFRHWKRRKDNLIELERGAADIEEGLASKKYPCLTHY